MTRAVKNAVSNALDRVGLYRPAFHFYHFVRRSPIWRRRHRLICLYRSVISPGDLVFDVGANDGLYADAMAAIGARVVAIEPNPSCVDRIRRMRLPGVTIVPVAVGAKTGTATLHVSSDPGFSGVSSMSESWLAVAKQSPRFIASGVRWDTDITVSVTTLDALAATYGPPKFVKIDIEGYEEEALNGITQQPHLLSVEFNREAMDALIRCLNHPSISKSSRFNYVVGEPVKFALEAWVDRVTFERHLASLSRETFGDVFIRR
jgi:FkbM family methyltransferase